MNPENHIQFKLRLFDYHKDYQVEVGKYENIPITDLSIKELLTSCRKAFNKSIKQMEIELTNLKKGE